jgi:hypothetical protein
VLQNVDQTFVFRISQTLCSRNQIHIFDIGKIEQHSSTSICVVHFTEEIFCAQYNRVFFRAVVCGVLQDLARIVERNETLWKRCSG